MKSRHIKFTEEQNMELENEKKLSGETINTIVRAAVSEYLKKRKKERGK